jgi:hypothetical protein
MENRSKYTGRATQDCVAEGSRGQSRCFMACPGHQRQVSVRVQQSWRVSVFSRKLHPTMTGTVVVQ